MPTITRTTSGMIGPDSGTIQSNVNSIRSAFFSGNLIKASDINDHYHSTADLYASGNYGNTSPYPAGDSYDTNPENTSRMYDNAGYYGAAGQREPAPINVGDVVTASFHQSLKTMFEGANGHYHQIDDRTG